MSWTSSLIYYIQAYWVACIPPGPSNKSHFTILNKMMHSFDSLCIISAILPFSLRVIAFIIEVIMTVSAILS
jgi:hypothetical protein